MLSTSCIEIIEALVDALRQQQKVFLASVLSTWGSSPRPPGSLMLWSESTGILGSVSGGCIEEDLLEKFKQDYFLNADKTTQLISYGDTHASNTNANSNNQSSVPSTISLPCGGVLTMLLEHVKFSDLPNWESILQQLKQRQGVYRHVDLNSGLWQYESSAPQSTQLRSTQLRSTQLRSTQLQGDSASIFIGPTRKLLIIGANQVAWYLANFANTLDFSVSICDPNQALGSQWFNSHFHLYNTYPDGIVSKAFNDNQCAVVAVSHDPRIDDMAMMEALPSQAFYVGAMGSLKTSKARRQRLLELDISEQAIQRLHAPIGIDIGSKTPAEIAMSIAAQLVHEYQQLQVDNANCEVSKAPLQQVSEV